MCGYKIEETEADIARVFFSHWLCLTRRKLPLLWAGCGITAEQEDKRCTNKCLAKDLVLFQIKPEGLIWNDWGNKIIRGRNCFWGWMNALPNLKWDILFLFWVLLNIVSMIKNNCYFGVKHHSKFLKIEIFFFSFLCISFQVAVWWNGHMSARHSVQIWILPLQEGLSATGSVWRSVVDRNLHLDFWDWWDCCSSSMMIELESSGLPTVNV